MANHSADYPVVVTATFVADPLAPTFSYWTAELGLPHDLVVAPYGQVLQHLLDPHGPLVRTGPGANVVLVRPQDWARDRPAAPAPPSAADAPPSPDPTPPGHLRATLGADGRAAVRRVADELVEAVAGSARQRSAPLLVVLCPASPALLADPADGGFLTAIEERIAAELRRIPGVGVLTTADTVEAYDLPHHADDYADELARVPYTPAGYAVLGTAVVRRLHALRTARPKVIVVDADNTLWDGVVGEDGVDGIRIGPHRQELHRLLVRQQEAGALLCLSSKNSEAEVREVFRRRPELGLELSQLTALRVDWRPKHETLRELAAELDLGLDSFLFLDDSPAECAELRAACPEVLVLNLPAGAAPALSYLRHVWALDRPVVTGEDRLRTELYQRESRRRELRASSAGLAEFVAGLRLEVRLTPATSGQADRLAQLTQRTNQFNTSTVRRTAADFATADELRWAVDVSDRFGAYGLVGLVSLTVDGTALRVDDLLLSCRVLGRGVEHRVFAAIGAAALERGLDTVDVPVRRTARNQPARDFVTRVAGPPDPATGVHRMGAADAAAVRYTPEQPVPAGPSATNGPAEPNEPAAPDRAADAAGHADRLDRIARELATGAALHRAILPPPPDAGPTAGPADARTPTELAVARLWAEVLGVAPVSVWDSFFALGGQSLQVVQFMARVRAGYGVELPVDLLFTTGFTVAQAARAIDDVRPVSGADIDLLIAQVEALSDDEVAALLAAEEA
ncbi:HAD-IIIC family phosphatase [Micromonospora echinospora]|uniref:HAD-IIIC family phosphatase n=1 Tax=Micromonospora echinospora TaxID=1877 RepID=UPI00340884AB